MVNSVFKDLIPQSLLIFFGKMIGILFQLAFCNALFSFKAQRGKIKPAHFETKGKESFCRWQFVEKKEMALFVGLLQCNNKS
ncbi:MAG TPA: hypothetical protein VLI68_11430 [Hanamia sp.]|jgi:hypothetical protein|nr:hypothetical protein [Hanamia sp.]